MTYDPLDRILTAQTQAISGQDCWGLQFGADGLLGDDALANLLAMTAKKNGTGCQELNLSVSVGANNHITNPGFSYDADGNVTADGVYTYAYNAENQITSAGGVNYTYDGDGLRVEKSGGTLYWRSYTGQVIEETDASGNMTTDYIYFGGRQIAWRDSGGHVFYLFADALGSTRAVTTGSGTGQTPGQLCWDADYYPYGQENDYTSTLQTTACPPTYKFTGYEYDSETGNYYAYARYYDPRIGRFLSADPLGGWIGNPQSLNRYSYVINNPESLVDPSGTCGGNANDPCPPPPPPPEAFDPGYACTPDLTLVPDSEGGEEWGYEWSCEATPPGGGDLGGGAGQSATAPDTKKCTGNARVLRGNAKKIGRPGGFSPNPRVGPPIPVTANGAAVIPSQWGGKGALRPSLNQISGVFPSAKASFQGVVDVIGGAPPAGFPAGSNVRSDLMSLNPGTLILELPGGKDLAVTTVTLTIPAIMNCPAGTTEVP